MADVAHLTILKWGVTAWNQWREDNPGVVPDLSGADLRRVDLRGVDLSNSYLVGTYLCEADLTGANLGDATLGGADLRGATLREAVLGDAYLRGVILSRADLRKADLSESYLREVSLDEADLHGADLHGVDLFSANLRRVNLHGADLVAADLSGADLHRADFSQARIGWTIFADNDLSEVKGLDTISHNGPSTVGVDTLFKSRNNIPPVFLRGCGFSDWQIEAAKLYEPDLTNQELGDIIYKIHDLRVQHPLQISSLFISYSHADAAFVDLMERYLVEAGIRFWRDVHHATAGPLERQVDRAIRLNPTVLLVLSESAVGSDWVEHEVRLARKVEKEKGRDVLCPIALDDSWKTCRWPERLLEQIMEYNILDFSCWRDAQSFLRTFKRLLEGLNLFYRKEDEES